MKTSNSLFVLRLCALSRLHTDGAGALAESVGYSSSNLMSVLAGRRGMPEDVATRLSAALSFSAEGFSNSGAIEPWLARRVDDLLLLKEQGFQLRVLSRLVTDREQGNALSVVYKFILLQVIYQGTQRFVVLRMTKNGIDELLKYPEFALENPGPALINLPAFRYRKLDKLMRLQAVAPSRLVKVGRGQLQSADIAVLVNVIFQKTEEEQVGDEIAASPLPMAAEKMRRHRLYVSTIKEAYRLRGGRQPHVAYGVNQRGQEVPIEIHPVFVGEMHELVKPAKTALEHLIVVLEHQNGVIEVLYEGPRKLISKTVEGNTNSGRPRRVAVDEFRALNAQVLASDRLAHVGTTVSK